MIHKAHLPLRSLGDWEEHAQPKSDKHWVPGRSAMEMARAWAELESPELPPEVAEALAGHPDFELPVEWSGEPEALVRFDGFGGPANVDLLLDAEDARGTFVVAVEGKADESFGPTVAKALSAALERKVKSHASRGVDRIQDLASALFGPRNGKKAPRVSELRYQLLTVSAAALAEAARLEATRAVVLVHEFRTEVTSPEYLERNAEDLERFVRRVSGGAVEGVAPGRLYGPFSVPGRPVFDEGVGLYVGKVVGARWGELEDVGGSAGQRYPT